MRIYISGPITGMQDLNRKAFLDAQRTLEQMGHIAINPFNIKNNGTWNDAMRNDIKALCDCDAIYMLKGWSKSRGAKIELMIAKKLELIIFHF